MHNKYETGALSHCDHNENESIARSGSLTFM